MSSDDEMTKVSSGLMHIDLTGEVCPDKVPESASDDLSQSFMNVSEEQVNINLELLVAAIELIILLCAGIDDNSSKLSKTFHYFSLIKFIVVI